MAGDKSGLKLISIFIPSLRGGGVERMQLHLARGFLERGYQVDLVLLKREGVFFDFVPKEVNIVELGSSRVATSLPGLVRYLRKRQPLALLSAMDHCNIVALIARRLSGVDLRVVVSVHSIASIEIANSNLRAKLLPHIIRRIYSWADGIVAVSQGSADDLARLIGKPYQPVHVIHNPVVISEICELADESLEHEWFADDEIPVVLSVGRLTGAKDFETLIRAIYVAKKSKLLRLLILGEGEERAKLESLILELNLDGSVQLPGFVKNPYCYMSKADVFVMSSRWEAFGNVLVEALALKMPIVATNCPNGPSEILNGGEFGQLVGVGDIVSMATAILTSLESEIDGDLLSRRAAEFSYRGIADQYLQKLIG